MKNETSTVAANRTISSTFSSGSGSSDRARDPLETNTGEAIHGGINVEELKRFGICLNQVIDFSSNVLAHGPSPSVLAAVRDAMFAAYPDRECIALRGAISKRFHVDPSRIIVGNGSCELIHLISRAVIQSGDSVLVVGPTFSEYQRASHLAQATVVECRANASDRFAVPIDDIESHLRNEPFSAVWLCNPNNPTGSIVCEKQILQWIRAFPRTIFVVDESYIEFAENAKSLIGARESNLVVLRSMTKSYGIAGLRLGYAVASPELNLQLCRLRVPWTVSAPAQAAGIAALSDSDYYRRAIEETLASKRELFSDLTSLGFSTIASDANFFLLQIDNANQVRSTLLEDGIVVRDCNSFGLPNFLRIAVLDRSNNRRLVQGLCRIVGKETLEPSAVTAAPQSLQETQSNAHSDSQWDAKFRDQLGDLFRLRRDVRRFKRDPIAPDALKRWIEAACLAPSVGLSQPWKLVSVNDTSRRLQMIQEFESQNQLAGQRYDSDVTIKYHELKLSGMKEAPEHLAVFVDPDPIQGRGLGRQTMPESVAYSVVAAIQNFWLAARSEGVGVGWVSIVRPQEVNRILAVPDHWQLIAYLCVGYPLHSNVDTPELESLGWESRSNLEEQWHQR